MENIKLFESFSYVIINLFLMVYFLIMLVNRGGKFFALGYGITLIAQISYWSINLLQSSFLFNNLDHIFFVSNIISTIFFVLGINYFSKVRPKENSLDGKQLYFSFKGRIPRRIFWELWMVNVLIGLFYGVIVIAPIWKNNINLSDGSWIAIAFIAILSLLSLLFNIWTGLAMQFKRWHDRGYSGWMVLIGLIPVIGTIWALVELGFLKGTAGPNKYGDDPLQPAGTVQPEDIPAGVEPGGGESTQT